MIQRALFFVILGEMNYYIIFIQLLTKFFLCGIIFNVKCLGVAQMVARYLGVVEAVGSSPVTQTSLNNVDTPFARCCERRTFYFTVS